MMKVAAIVPSAGKGKRIRSSIPKPYIRLNNKPILIHTLLRLSKNSSISEVIVVCNKKEIKRAERIIKRYSLKKVRVVEGGKERKDSVLNGLKNVSKDIDYVLIHDAVRPFITKDIIERSLKMAKKYKAACVGVPVKPTLKYVKKDYIVNTPDRNDLWEAQTPQVFKRSLLENAYRRNSKKTNATDDCMLVERIGIKPRMVLGSYSNIKITTKEDLKLAKLMICGR
ncbi:MAG: 2-C-methyl-D-erythritol 4-phosphate cytidylyltransferase [Candidatus Omnitrophota bacterium]